MCATRKPTNADVVGAMYQAFERRDIPHILDQLDDLVSWDADWDDNSAQSADVVLMRPRRGPAEVAEFFALLAEWRFQDFAVLDIIGTGRQVAAEVRIDAVLPNGGRIADQTMHLWTFGEDGQVVRFRTYTDTAKQIAADSGADTVHGTGTVVTGFLLGLRGGRLR
ncbi:nuclear transport factor 2 family protein [Nocardia sp. NPDC050710]|uniref:nuclear transport factor 2 family protein n=1 Tax=Nocardia sp. NPDC050710 TaxID=3157220 RepID=UPI00340439BB